MTIKISQISFAFHENSDCNCSNSDNDNLTKNIDITSIDFSGLSKETVTPLLKSAHFPELNNITQEQISTIRDNLQTQGFDESIKFSNEVLNILNNLVEHSEQINRVFRIEVNIAKPKSTLVNQLSMLGSNILSHNGQLQELFNSDAGYVVNPRTQNWHFDKASTNQLNFCLTINGVGTEYIEPQYNDDFVKGNVNLPKSLIKSAQEATMMIFCGAAIETPNQFFNQIPPLFHRSPSLLLDESKQRKICLVRFKLAKESEIFLR